MVRLAAVPGLGADSAQQIIAELGPKAATFRSPQELASWVGVCPGREESAEVSKNNQTPKGNRTMRRVLNQAANSARKTKGSIFQALYQRWLPRLGHNKTIWAIAHRLCRIVWIILHRGEQYIEFGNSRDPKDAAKRTSRLIHKLQVNSIPARPGFAAESADQAPDQRLRFARALQNGATSRGEFDRLCG